MPRIKKQMGKKWYKSKSCWAGILEMAGGIALAIAGNLAAGGALTIAGVIEIILRAVTNTKITK